MLDQKYNCVNTLKKLIALNEILMLNKTTPRSKLLALDCESNGLNINKSVVCGISLAASKDRGYYIPLLEWVYDPKTQYSRTRKGIKYDVAYKSGHLRCIWSGKEYPEFVTPKEYNINEIYPAIPELLETWTKNSQILLWNQPYDVNMLRNSMGVDINSSVVMDGALLVHILDENFPTALKKNVGKYREVFGINPHVLAATEKKELEASIIKNGGNKAGEVWRADLDIQYKYAASDAFYTFGICKAAWEDFGKEYGSEGKKWFLGQETMPLATEVVVDMKHGGVYIDVPYFEKLLVETQIEMQSIEDKLIGVLTKQKLLQKFTEGKSESASQGKLIRKIIALENLKIPTTTSKAGEVKESLAKKVVEKAYAENPHWIFGYILGTEEIKCSEAKLAKISKELFYEDVNKIAVKERKPIKRYSFNINSDPHLRWLFCECLGIPAQSLPGTDSSTPKNIIPSMSAEVLKEYMLPKFEWVDLLLSYKKLAKLESTYIRPAVMLNEDGWLYMDFRQNGTTTGRFCCRGGLNLQTLPRVDDEMEMLGCCQKCDSENVEIIQSIEVIASLKCKDCHYVREGIVRPSAIKRGFIAPPGYKIIAADYSSLEPRAFAVCSGSQDLKDVFLKGLDLYSQVYCKTFDKENKYSADPKAANFLKKVDKAKRQGCKAWVLGVPYGAAAAQVAIATNSTIRIKDKVTKAYIKIPNVKEGQRIIDGYLGAFPDLKNYMENQELQAATQGYVETLLKRKRHLPKAKIIQDILIAYELDFQDLRSCRRKDLEKSECSAVSKKTGKRLKFTKECLYEICEALDIGKKQIAEKGYWAYIRALLKTDLNNAKNAPIQGLSAHIVNRAMIDVARSLKKYALDARIFLSVHDELILYAQESQVTQTAKCLREGMENNIFTKLLDIPMIAEPIICNNLAEAK